MAVLHRPQRDDMRPADARRYRPRTRGTLGTPQPAERWPDDEAPVASTPERPRPTRALLALAALAFAASFAVGWGLFPLGSINHDEPMYRFGAELIGAGHLTLPADVGPFAPWNGGIRGDRWVPAYAPVWPAVLAAGDALGSMRVAVAATSAAAVVLLAALGRELFGRWREGLVAAGVLLASPLFLVQSGTYLGYLFQLVLVLGLALLVLGALRRWPESGAPPRAVVGRLVAVGAVAGVAGFARPYDTLLAALPLGVLVGVRARTCPGMLRRWLGWTALGVAVPLGLMAAHGWATMGSPLRSSFSVTGSANRLGFGQRGIFESDTFDFTPAKGGASVLLTMWEGPGWVFGGVGLVALAGYGLWRERGRPGAWAIAGLGAAFLLGYGLWWSSYSIARLWPGQTAMGTFYHLPVLVPLALFGAAGLVALLEHRRAWGWAAVGTLVVLTAVVLPPKVRPNRDVSSDYREVQRLVEEADLGRAVLFMEDRGKAGYSSAAPFLENSPTLDDPLLFADERGAADIRVLEAMPDRAGARLRAEARSGDDLFEPTRFVERLEVRRGPEVPLGFRVVNPSDAPLVRARVVVDGEVHEVVLDRSSAKGDGYTVSWDLAAGSRTVLGASVSGSVTRAGPVPVEGEGTVVVQALFGGNGKATERYERRYPYVVEGGEVHVLTPGWGRFLFQFGDPVWVNMRVDEVLAEAP